MSERDAVAAQPEPLNVLFCCDRVYLSGLVVAVESMLQHVTCPSRVHVLAEGIGPDLQQKLLADWRRHRSFAGAAFHDAKAIPADYRGSSHFSRCSFGKVSFQRYLNEP